MRNFIPWSHALNTHKLLLLYTDTHTQNTLTRQSHTLLTYSTHTPTTHTYTILTHKYDKHTYTIRNFQFTQILYSHHTDNVFLHSTHTSYVCFHCPYFADKWAGTSSPAVVQCMGTTTEQMLALEHQCIRKPPFQ